jgi:hypothetical protein
MSLIEEGWKKVPDWRFGQLIENLKRYIGQDLFYIEDNVLEEKIKDFFDLDESISKKDKIKIVLIQDYGFPEPDEDIRNKLEGDNLLINRTDKDLIKYIEEKGTEISDSYYRLNDNFFFIIEVDTSRPWTIEVDNDGSNYIQYLDYQIIDSDTNYCKLNYKNFI